MRGVILCHGMESNKESYKLVRMSRRLSEKGFCALRYDFAGAGESAGRFAQITHTGQAQDLEAAVGWMRRSGVRTLGIIGSSMGGSVALLFAGRHTGVSALAVLAAPADPRAIVEDWLSPQQIASWREKGYLDFHERTIHKTFLEDLDRIDVLGAAGKVCCPLLVLHGEQDETVPVAQAHALYRRAAGVKQLRIFPRADHRFSDPADLGAAMDACEDWMGRHLAADDI